MWEVLIGFDKQPTYWIFTLILLIYNALRGILTFILAPHREEEERSGQTPFLRTRRLDEYLRGEETAVGKYKATFAWLWDKKDTYSWLIWPHRLVSFLFLVAVGAFAYHTWSWMTLRVWVR